jgi:hypothetical protein
VAPAYRGSALALRSLLGYGAGAIAPLLFGDPRLVRHHESRRVGVGVRLAHLLGEHREPDPARAVRFRAVGVYRRHGKLGGQWRDCVVVERLLDESSA